MYQITGHLWSIMQIQIISKKLWLEQQKLLPCVRCNIDLEDKTPRLLGHEQI